MYFLYELPIHKSYTDFKYKQLTHVQRHKGGEVLTATTNTQRRWRQLAKQHKRMQMAVATHQEAEN